MHLPLAAATALVLLTTSIVAHAEPPPPVRPGGVVPQMRPDAGSVAITRAPAAPRERWGAPWVVVSSQLGPVSAFDGATIFWLPNVEVDVAPRRSWSISAELSKGVLNENHLSATFRSRKISGVTAVGWAAGAEQVWSNENRDHVDPTTLARGEAFLELRGSRFQVRGEAGWSQELINFDNIDVGGPRFGLALGWAL